MKKLTFAELALLTEDLAKAICRNHALYAKLSVYAIPRGGVPVALALQKYIDCLRVVDTPEEADIFVDDIIDSGATLEHYCEKYPGKVFYALIDKKAARQLGFINVNDWFIFPWENEAEGSIEDNIRRILQFVGEDASREGLQETPRRVAKAWVNYWASGYNQDPAKILKVFTDGAEKHNQMITVKDIPIYSHCEHHLAPIFGTATISYIPDGKIVGLSKLSRLAEMFARRLQVQERLTDQIADALFEHLQPKGVGVVIKARHMCMESRGICQQGHHTVTTALRGAMLTEPETRAEFMQVANS